MHSKILLLFYIVVCLSCNNRSSYTGINHTGSLPGNTVTIEDINPYSQLDKIPLPGGFERIATAKNSFAKWLASMKLKKDKTVYLFNGTPKQNQSAQFAVLDISVGNTDLQQCADAVMRLRAEYLFANRQYSSIRFADNNGGVYQYHEPYDYNNLQVYLKRVFGMCGSASLAKQLNNKPFNNIEAGDVFIKGGFPGHAVIVMDVAIKGMGKKIFLLAQSYMPAQDIHLLLNPSNHSLSPWYEVNEEATIETPEYTFTRHQLKGW